MSAPKPGSGEAEGDAPQDRKNEPKYNRFTQQELPACRPLLTPTVVISVFFLLGVVFIPIGAIVLSASSSVAEQTYQYDSDPACTDQAVSRSEAETNLLAQNGTGITCAIEITIEADMKAPVYFYYQLHNYYQNHRRCVQYSGKRTMFLPGG